jgi:hypothetical protein
MHRAALPGFHPSKVLPCVVDVGTNNAALRADPLYCGLDQPRITGPAYYELLDEVCLMENLVYGFNK